MAKKKDPKVQATADDRMTKPVRLDLSEADFERLEKCAKEKGLTKASYARMAVLKEIKIDEANR